jgi:hypothetical protein
MASVELAATAVEDLDTLILTHSLSDGTRTRVAHSLRSLELFPRLGPALTGRWTGLRFVLGPWRWMLLVYTYIEAEDRVVVLTIQDARSSAAATAKRG